MSVFDMKLENLAAMPHTRVACPGDGTVRVWKTDTLEPDINTYVDALGVDFHDGVIEVDVRGGLLPDAPADARGFIGITFRGAPDGREFEGFYIRPTNGLGCDDPVRRAHGCQYFSFPGYTFAYVRAFGLSGYEAPVDSIALDQWSHIKAVVRGARAEFFVDGAPVLTVDNLRHGPNARGGVGLYVDNGTDGLFKNLEITSQN